MVNEKHKINILPTSPTFLNMMLMENVADKFNLSSLKLITYGTEQMQKSLLTRLKKAFPRTRLLQTFGTSETGKKFTDQIESFKINKVNGCYFTYLNNVIKNHLKYILLLF